jgi:hypothetical protein
MYTSLSVIFNRSTKRVVYTASESDVALDNDTYQNLLRSNKFKCIGPVAVRLVRLVSFRLFYSIQQHSVGSRVSSDINRLG